MRLFAVEPLSGRAGRLLPDEGLRFQNLDHDLRLFVETVPWKFLTGENEPEIALWRDDTAKFDGLRVDQLSVAGSMLRRAHDRFFRRFAELIDTFRLVA